MERTSSFAQSNWVIALACCTPIALRQITKIASKRFTLPPFFTPSLRSTMIVGAGLGAVTKLAQLKLGREGKSVSEGEEPPEENLQPVELPAVKSVSVPRDYSMLVLNQILFRLGDENAEELTEEKFLSDCTTIGYALVSIAQQRKISFLGLRAFKDRTPLPPISSTSNIDDFLMITTWNESPSPIAQAIEGHLIQLYKAAYQGGRIKDYEEVLHAIEQNNASLKGQKTDTEAVTERISLHLKGVRTQFEVTGNNT